MLIDKYEEALGGRVHQGAQALVYRGVPVPDLLQHHAHDDDIIHGRMLQEVDLHEELRVANLSAIAHPPLQKLKCLQAAVLDECKGCQPAAGRCVGRDAMVKKLFSITGAHGQIQCSVFSGMEMTAHPFDSMLHVSCRMLTWLRATLVSTTR